MNEGAEALVLRRSCGVFAAAEAVEVDSSLMD